jgi:uncharacterized protein
VRFIFLFTIGVLISCSSVRNEIIQHREEYKSEFLSDPRSPLKEEDLKNLDFYKPVSYARVNSKFTLTPEAEPFDMPTYSGLTRSYRKWGEAKFLWKGDSITLSIYQNLTLLSNPLYKDYLFLPFKDETNGLTTYGGGRYLNMSKADTEDGFVTIDFNKSYNPWCAYSDGFNCPIPPRENHLSFPIYAGEKLYKGEIKH